MKSELTELCAINYNNSPGPSGWHMEHHKTKHSDCFRRFSVVTNNEEKQIMNDWWDTLPMEDRRIAKTKQQQQRYTKINNTIKQQCRQAKENWVSADCQEAKAPIRILQHNGISILDPVNLCNAWKSYAKYHVKTKKQPDNLSIGKNGRDRKLLSLKNSML